MPSKPFKRGDYQAPSSTDVRGPCPVVNSLANHGYISRDGRQVREAEIRNAMKELGISITITSALSYGAWLEHHDVPKKGFWAFLRAPFAYLLQNFGCRDPKEVDAAGVPCMDLDQLNRHGAIEHDVSLSRRDFAQGDNYSPQKDLIEDMISSSTNGKVVTTQDLAVFRLKRIQQQRNDNPKLLFEDAQNTMGCGEAAFIQKVFGDRSKDWAIPVSYLQALFGEERLPIREGWRKRSWWKLGFIELTAQTRTFMRALETLK